MNLKLHRLLIVDDHAASALSLVHFCSAVAAQIDIAHSAQAALELLRACVYDCIIMDCRLPDQDGLTVTRWIRETPDQLNRHTLIIGVTADVRYTRALCMQAGMNAVVHKPYPPRAIVELISSLV